MQFKFLSICKNFIKNNKLLIIPLLITALLIIAISLFNTQETTEPFVYEILE